MKTNAGVLIVKGNVNMEKRTEGDPMSENTYRHRKDATDFDLLKSQISSLRTSIEVDTRWMIEHPDTNERSKLNKEIDIAQNRIIELKNILIKEPPLPELPPSQPLVKVCGVLEELSTLFTKGYFTDREYESDEFARQESHRQWGSVLLAAIGDSAAASVNAQDSIRESHTYDFVQGKINWKPFHGWLGYCSAQCGDYVEMAAADHGDHYEVYALAIPQLRVITTIPCCAHGIIGKANAAAIGGIPFSIGVATIGLIVSFFAADNILQMLQVTGWSFLGAVAYMALVGPIVYDRMKDKPAPTVVLGQRIFTALGFPHPEKVNLHMSSRLKLWFGKDKALPEPASRMMPDKYYYVSHYFYY